VCGVVYVCDVMYVIHVCCGVWLCGISGRNDLVFTEY
jgi:hypothetical protein